ncbi:MAG TPA: BglII/BstYI family type II restriction endonuclease [Fimbriimonadaceae bacterium]|nr:BglII/BstYI family type II restriction endonuclease [Fimbriimonadaceae bacterium]
MRIVQRYSHLNGWEYIKVHHPKLWTEIEEVIASIDAEQCRTKKSKEKRTMDKLLYAPKELNKSFTRHLKAKDWDEQRVSYWVTEDVQLIRQTLPMAAKEQHSTIVEAGSIPIRSYNQTDFVKDRVAIEVQFGKYSFVAYDLFVKHLAFYVGDKIDVGVEILPMKELQAQMSSGVAYYEGELYNVIRQGRGVPAVPLVLLGIAP